MGNNAYLQSIICANNLFEAFYNLSEAFNNFSC